LNRWWCNRRVLGNREGDESQGASDGKKNRDHRSKYRSVDKEI